MKKIFVFSMLISLAMICSCQKHDSTAEAQLGQRKAELDSRQQALDEREKALEQRERAVADREKAIAGGRIIQSQRPMRNAAEIEAERQRRIQQLPAELRALIPDRSRVNAGRAHTNPVQGQRSPAAEVPGANASSPSPSPTPQ